MKLPRTPDELRDWVSREFQMSQDERAALVSGIDSVLQWHRGLLESSKGDAIRAVSEGFTAKLQRLNSQLREKDTRTSAIARYFEEVVADLSDKSQRDAKTKLFRFDAFRQRFEAYLAAEQRVQCVGVGVVDINRGHQPRAFAVFGAGNDLEGRRRVSCADRGLEFVNGLTRPLVQAVEIGAIAIVHRRHRSLCAPAIWASCSLASFTVELCLDPLGRAQGNDVDGNALVNNQ